MNDLNNCQLGMILIQFGQNRFLLSDISGLINLQGNNYLTTELFALSAGSFF